VRLISPIGDATGGNGNLSTSLSNVARLVAHPKFVWVFNANCDGTIIYNDPVQIMKWFLGRGGKNTVSGRINTELMYSLVTSPNLTYDLVIHRFT
jgi:hypothetical protein